MNLDFRKYFILVVFVLSSLGILANNGIEKGLYKLSKDSFVNRYSFDDTSDALIYHTYHQRSSMVGVMYASRLDLLYKVQDYKELKRLRTESDRKIVKETIAKQEFKLSRSGFLKKYGTDDSAKALINIIFNDRMLGWIALPIYPLFVSAPGFYNTQAELRYYGATGYLSEDGLRTVIAGEYYGLGLSAFLISGSGAYLVLVNSRKKLCRALKFYKSNGYLPRQFHERVANKIERNKTDDLIREYKKKKKEEEYKKLLLEMKSK